MKKTVLALVAFLTIMTQIHGQNKRGYIGISLGPSIPLSDFSSKDPNNNAAGWANTGAVFDLSFAYKLGKGNFGITALLRGQANPTDAQALADNIAKQAPAANWTVESGSWGIGGIMLGGFGSFPISEKSSFDMRAMIGFLSANSPEITVTGSAMGVSAWIKQSSASAASFSYLLGAGFKFGLGKSLYLLTNLDYLGSKPEFEHVETIASNGSRSFSTFSQSQGTINLSVGLAFRI